MTRAHAIRCTYCGNPAMSGLTCGTCGADCCSERCVAKHSQTTHGGRAVVGRRPLLGCGAIAALLLVAGCVAFAALGIVLAPRDGRTHPASSRRATTAATDRTATAPNTPTVNPAAEQAAAIKIGLAKRAVAIERPDLARRYLAEVIEQYPDTKAAVEAKAMLGTLKP